LNFLVVLFLFNVSLHAAYLLAGSQKMVKRRQFGWKILLNLLFIKLVDIGQLFQLC